MQLFKVYYWEPGGAMHRETIQVDYHEAETPGALIRKLMESGLNVEKVIPYTEEEMTRDKTPITEREQPEETGE